MVEEKLSAAGIAIADIRFDEPTLENTFVATLRALGQEIHDEPFPGHRDRRAQRGEVAIGAANLTKQFGSFTAVHDVRTRSTQSTGTRKAEVMRPTPRRITRSARSISPPFALSPRDSAFAR